MGTTRTILALVGGALALAGGCEVVSGIGGYEIGTTTKTTSSTQSTSGSTSTSTSATTSTTTTTPSGPPRCDDGLKNGGETDVDCGGPCSDKQCAGGQGCENELDCGEGLGCWAGFCCYQKCVTMCMACTAALTGQQDGECVDMLAGTQDVNPADGKNTCNGSYHCDGKGGCN